MSWWKNDPLAEATTTSKWWEADPVVSIDLPEEEPAPRFAQERGLGVPEPVAAKKPKMVIEPFDASKHKPRDLGLGGESTEILITEDAPDGGYWNIPTVWWNDKGEPRVFSREEAQQIASMYEAETGKKFPRFSSPEEGVTAAQSRSNAGGGQGSALATRRQAQIDSTDDARAERGFGRSAYLDDGMTPNLPTNTPVRDITRTASAEPRQPISDLGKRAARGATEVAASFPEAVAVGQSAVASAAQRGAEQSLVQRDETIARFDEILRQPDLTAEKRTFYEAQKAAYLEGQKKLKAEAAKVVTPASEQPDFARGDKLRNASLELFGTPDPQFDDRFLSQLSEGAGNMAGFVAVTLLTGPLGGAAAGSGLNTSSMYREALEYGASEQEARQAAYIGSIIGASEVLPIGRALGVIPDRLKPKIANALARRVASALKAGGEEAAQEALAQVANNWTAQGIFDPDRKLSEGALEGAVIGGILGGALGGIASSPAPVATDRFTPNDRERINSPRLTENDRKSPIPNDIIDDGKAAIDDLLSGKIPSGAVPMDTLYGKPVAPLDEAAPNVRTPTPEAVQRPLPTDRLSPTLGAAPQADTLPQRPEATVAPTAPVAATERTFEDLPEEDGDVPTGRTIRVYDDGQVEYLDQEQNAQTQEPVPQDQEPLAVPDVPVAAPKPTKPVTPPRETLQKRPLTNALKSVGVKPGSPLAVELEARGINARTAPGLFKATGHTDWDNLPASEWGDYARVIGEDGNGYLSRDGLIQAVEGEMRGEPVQVGNQIALQEAKGLREYAQEFGRDDDVEIDLSDVPEARSYIPVRDEDISTPTERAQWVRRDIDAALSVTNMKDIITPAEYAELYDGLEANGGNAEDMLWGIILRSVDSVADESTFAATRISRDGAQAGAGQANPPAVRQGLGGQVGQSGAESRGAAGDANAQGADVRTPQAEGAVDGRSLSNGEVPKRGNQADAAIIGDGEAAPTSAVSVPGASAQDTADVARNGLAVQPADATPQAADVPQVAPDVATASKTLADARKAFNVLDQNKKIEDAQAYFAASSALSKARDGMADALAERGGRIELKTDNGLGAVITPRPDGKPGARITYFDGKGFSGDTSHDTLKAAVRDAIGQGYEIEAKGYLKNRQALWPKSKRVDVNEKPQAQNTPAEGIKAAPNEGFVVRNKDTGEVVMETRDQAKIDALNTDKYEAVPVRQHLAELNDTDSKARKAAEDGGSTSGSPALDKPNLRASSPETHKAWKRAGAGVPRKGGVNGWSIFDDTAIGGSFVAMSDDRQASGFSTEQEARTWAKVNSPELAADTSPDDAAGNLTKGQMAAVKDINKTLRSENAEGGGLYTSGSLDIQLDDANGGDIKFTIERSRTRYKGRMKQTDYKTKSVLLSEIGDNLSASAMSEVQAYRDYIAQIDQEIASESKPTTEQTEAGTQTVVPGAEQSTERSEKARDADRKREADVRAQQSKMRTGVPQDGPGGLFDTQGDMFKEQRQPSAQDAATVEAALPDLRKRLNQMMLKRVSLEAVEGATFQGAFEARGDDLRILVGQTQDGMKTVNHEAVHALRNLNLFTDAEWDALTDQAVAEWLDKYDIANRYDDLNAEAQIEEAIAEAFADFVAERTEPGPIKSAFAKMRRMFRALKEWVTGNPSVQGVFEAVDSGRVGARQSQGGTDTRAMQKQINTATEAFKRWFGDSKVVDADGKPLVVYRGMSQDMQGDAFRVSDGGTFGEGIYLTSDPEYANVFADGEGGQVFPVYASIQNPAPQSLVETVEANATAQRRSSRAILEDMGYDGMIAEDGEIVAFRPEQIKSVYNRGTFDPNDARIRYQRQATARQKAQETFDQMPRDVAVPNRAVFDELFARNRSMFQNIGQAKGAVGDRMDVAREYMQDRILPLRRVQEAIEREIGQPIAEEMNAYVKEETYHGKVGRRLEDIRQFTLEPISDLIAESDSLDAGKVNDYLTALHAEERNARIAKINPEMPDGGSGMSNAEAQKILKDAKLSKDYAVLKEIARLVAKLRDDTLQLRVDAGLMTAKDAAILKAMYENYVPLKGFEEFDGSGVLSDRPNVGRGYSVKGPETKRALGRKSRSFDVLANILSQAQEVAIRAEKNQVGKAVFDLASQYPSENIWRVREVETKRVFNKQTGLVETRSEAPTARALAENEMAVKIDGKEYRIEFMDERLTRAMGAVKVGQMGDLVRILSLPARYFSAVNTMIDPEFVVRNAFRDMQAAQINIRNFGEADRNRIAKGMIANWPKAFAAAFKGQGANKPDTEWTKWYREFEEAGAKVSFWKMEDADRMKSDLERQIFLKRGNIAKRAGKFAITPSAWFSAQDNAVLGFIERTNLAVDNAVRLAAYVEARKSGWSKQKAASLSKNLTVNFNRRGHYGPVMNALYPFYNAGMQGTQVLFRAMSNPKRMGKYVVGMIGVGFISDLINAAISDEDDDGVLAYDKIQKFKQEMSFQISTGDDVLTVPLSYGYNVFPYMGQLAGQVYRGVKDPDEAFIDFVDAAVSAFSPVYESDAMRTMLPMVMDLPYDLATNSDWLHRPIRPENPYGDYGPDAYKFYGGASEWAKGAADFANRATGGTIAEPGMIDVSPEYLDHIWGFASGGAGRFVSNTGDMAAKILSGKTDEIEGYRVPFARQVFSETGLFLDRDRYYRFREEVNEAAEARETAQEAGEPLSKLSYDLSKLKNEVKLADKVLRAIRKERAAVGDDATADQRKEWEAREAKAILRFNQKYVNIAGASIE